VQDCLRYCCFVTGLSSTGCVNGKMYAQVVPLLADDYDFLVKQLAEARQREQ